MTSQWVGSACTYHSLTKRNFPREDSAVCPGRAASLKGSSHRALFGRGSEPSAENGHSICPLEAGAAVLARSPAKLALEAIESSPELARLLVPLIEGGFLCLC